VAVALFGSLQSRQSHQQRFRGNAPPPRPARRL